MTERTATISDKAILRSIYIVSALVFAIVVVLFNLPKAETVPGFVKYLPKLNAIINGICSLLLIVSLLAIRKKNITLHKRLNITTFALSTIFLLSYVLFHSFGIETKYGDVDHNGVVDAAEKAAAGGTRMVYFVILITHIILAAGVLPLVLLSFYRGLTNKIELHRKLVRWSFPIWLYVTVSGVIVYLMISPYYNF